MSPGTDTLAVGKPELAATSVAVGDDAAHLVGATQQGRWPARGRPRRAHGGSRWTTPSRRRRTATPSASTRARPSTSKPSSAPIERSSSTLPRRWCPKWKSSPTITTSAARQSTRTSVHELLGRLLGARLVEGDDEAAVETGGGQQLELLLEVGEQARRRLGTHHRRGVPVEGDDGALEAAGRGPLSHLGDDRLVPEVHAVVGTDGDHAPGVGPGPGPDVVQHLHPREVRSGPARRAQPTA